jgi:Na+/H+ antiporter NhaD/arsenite permease-like protein
MDEPHLRWVIALVVFAGTYVGLALGRLPVFRVDRTGVAIIGGAIVVVSGVVSWDRAVASVDAHTLVLLFGMMIVAAYLRLSGFFRLVTYAAVRRAHTPVGLLGLIIVAAGVLSALFVNDVICLVMAPIVLDLSRQLRLPPAPYLIALATAANVGSVATLTGNPQNMLVGSFSGIGYRAFLLREAPIAVIGLAIVFGVIWLAYRRRLPAELAALDLEERFPVHRALMKKTLAAVSVMLVAFLAGVPVALVAIGGAASCLLTRRVNPEKVYREIDWGLLVLFSGLFVVIAGVEASGLTGELLDLASVIGLYRPAVLTAVTAVLSNLVSNVPDSDPDLRRADARVAPSGHGLHLRWESHNHGVGG